MAQLICTQKSISLMVTLNKIIFQGLMKNDQ